MLTWAAAVTLALAIGRTRIRTIMPAARSGCPPGQIPAAAAPAVPFLNKTGVSAGAVRLSALLAQQTTFSSRCAYAAR
jgi:hypothetical protein